MFTTINMMLLLDSVCSQIFGELWKVSIEINGTLKKLSFALQEGIT